MTTDRDREQYKKDDARYQRSFALRHKVRARYDKAEFTRPWQVVYVDRSNRPTGWNFTAERTKFHWTKIGASWSKFFQIKVYRIRFPGKSREGIVGPNYKRGVKQ